MDRTYVLSIPDYFGAIIRERVKIGVNRLSFEEFVELYSRYYSQTYSRKVDGPLYITDNPHNYQSKIKDIVNQGGSGFFHISCVDQISCCLHYYFPRDAGKRFAALYNYRLEIKK